MKALKILGGLLVLAVVVVAIVVFLGLQNLDKLVKAGVEEVGPEVVGTPVKLSDVKIKLTEGRGELHGLSVANPSGFSNANALSLGEIALELDPASLTGDVVVINEILIKGTSVLAELKGLKDTNLQALLNNIKANTGSGGQQQSSASSGSSSSDIRLAVKKFTFADSSIKLVSDQLGEKTLQLPAINLSNLGSASKGLTPEELAAAVVQPLLASAKEAVKDYVEENAKDKAEAKLKEKLSEKLGEDGGEKLDQLKSLFGK